MKNAVNNVMGAFNLIKPTFKPSFKPPRVMAAVTIFIQLYHLQTCFKLASNQMSTSVNRILYTGIWFEGRFEGGLKLSLKCLQTNLNFGMDEATTLNGLKLDLTVGFITVNVPYTREGGRRHMLILNCLNIR